MDIGDRFKFARIHILKMTQPEICKELNIASRTTISNWENKRAKPPMKYLHMISNKFNINFNWLISGNGDPNSTIQTSNLGKSYNNFDMNNIANNGDINYVKNMPNSSDITVNNSLSSATNINNENTKKTIKIKIYDKLLEFGKMKKEGLLSEEEFQEIKETLLSGD